MKSYLDKDRPGYMFVVCSECVYGLNGDKKTCPYGNNKQKAGLGCYRGELMPHLKEELKIESSGGL